MTDTIAEMLTRIRNAQLAGKKEVRIKASKLKLAIAKILEQEGFVEYAGEEVVNDLKNIKIDLKYYRVSNTQKIPAIRDIQRVSREGQRIYVQTKDIRNVKNKFGISIISTSKGVMTGAEARKNGLGGEYICEVW
jgi:small subunit ribosomal protein S8